MKKNMGRTDKATRMIVALVLVAAYLSGLVTGVVGVILVVVAGVFVLTSLISFCPLYVLLGANTCPREKRS